MYVCGQHQTLVFSATASTRLFIAVKVQCCSVSRLCQVALWVHTHSACVIACHIHFCHQVAVVTFEHLLQVRLEGPWLPWVRCCGAQVMVCFILLHIDAGELFLYLVMSL